MIGVSRDDAKRSLGLSSRIARWKVEWEPRWREIRFSLYLLRQSPLVMLGIIIIIGVFLMAVFAPWITPYGPEERIWTETKLPPSQEHLLGTDEIGGDVFSRIIWATRVDLSTAVTIVAFASLIGVALGVVSGFMGGKIDEILMRITDIFLAFPSLILAMAIAAALGRSWQNLMIALMLVWWPYYARIIRGQVLAEREKMYVEAARAVGASTPRIMFRHVLPNSIYPLLVVATMDLGGVIITAAALSFIGFGANPGMAEWGRMIADGHSFLFSCPWMAMFPGVAILITALGFNFVGDGLRDVLDPRLRR